MPGPSEPRPLAGLRVLELARILAGPWAGQILADLGSRIGFSPEREQLEYEKHVDLRRVRGDMNVGKIPARIDPAKATFRESNRSGKPIAKKPL